MHYPTLLLAHQMLKMRMMQMMETTNLMSKRVLFNLLDDQKGFDSLLESNAPPSFP